MKKHVLSVLIVLNLALIWGNSLLSGEVSAGVSGGVLAFLGRFLPWILTEAGHTFLRKAAHFSEFALLGLLIPQRYRLEKDSVPGHLALIGMAVACIDETLQLFTPGRASSLVDVWIDTAGFVLGFIVIFAAHTIITTNSKGERIK